MRGRKRPSDIFNLPPDDYFTENLIHEAFCAEKMFFFLYKSECRGEIVFCFLCVGDEGSAVQPFCCGSGREEEQTGSSSQHLHDTHTSLGEIAVLKLSCMMGIM